MTTVKWLLNTGHNAPYSTAPILSNLNAHGAWSDGSDYPAEYNGAWVSCHGLHKYMPAGEYMFFNDSTMDVTVMRVGSAGGFVVQAGKTRSETIDPAAGGFACYGPTANRLCIYPPGEKSGPYHDPLPLDAVLDKFKAFSGARFMNFQNINGGKSESYTGGDEWTGDFNNPRLLLDTADYLGQGEARFCIPHRWPEPVVKAWLDEIAELLPEFPGVKRVAVEHSNEVWNTQFRQQQEIGDLYSTISSDPDLPIGLARALEGNARRTAMIATHLYKTGSPVRVTLGTQAANRYVTKKQLEWYFDTGGGDLHSVSCTCYAGFGDDGWVDDLDTEAADGVDRALEDLSRTMTEAGTFGVGIDVYEGGQHFAPYPSSRKSEVRSFVEGSGWVPHLRRMINGATFQLTNQPYVPDGGPTFAWYSFAHDPSADHWGRWHSSFDTETQPRTQLCIDTANGGTTDPEEPEKPDAPILLDLNRDGQTTREEIESGVDILWRWTCATDDERAVAISVLPTDAEIDARFKTGGGA